jgi:hypothetical protein
MTGGAALTVLKRPCRRPARMRAVSWSARTECLPRGAAPNRSASTCLARQDQPAGEHQQARGDKFLASPGGVGEPATGDDSGDDAGELLVMVTEILAGALLKLVGAEEAQQADRCLAG